MSQSHRPRVVLPLCLLFIAACGDSGGADGGMDEIGTDPTLGSTGTTDSETGTTSTTDGSTTDPSDTEIPDSKFDVATMPDSPDICLVPQHIPCDHLSFPSEEQEAWRALGLNCPGEFQAQLDYNGHYLALMVHEGQLGTYNNPPTYPVREGTKMVVLSTGDAFDVISPGNGDGNTTLPGNDPGNLPSPMKSTDVSANEDCEDNPDLIGTGDCSNTIQTQWSQGNGAYDYAELRLSGEVPVGASGFSYNLAFFSTEYPNYYKTSFNDMYIAWLQSEQWTGNVSFDEMGNPISLNAGFLAQAVAKEPERSHTNQISPPARTSRRPSARGA
ncbi:MAG: hypothetical protein KC457_05395 [Myxococcales bacterium]|nr:hypothetical protein [Myxococcales bacterium]